MRFEQASRQRQSTLLKFTKRSAVRRGIFVEAEIKNIFKLRLVAVRKHRNMPP